MPQTSILISSLLIGSWWLKVPNLSFGGWPLFSRFSKGRRGLIFLSYCQQLTRSIRI